MLSFHSILTIAVYETRNLLRSWFFRIFFIITMVLLGIINSFVFTSARVPMMFRALPSTLPYLNLLLLNVMQAIIGIFLASDFLKYDNKLNTTDTIYIRSMTNADYILGKVLGVALVFGGMNMAVITMAMIFNVFFTQIPFIPSLYLWYPLLISVPTLVYIFGLSFLLMTLLRNQAMTFIILLGYIAISMFLLSDRMHHLFDYMAFEIPLLYSDFTGFTGLTNILLHRGIYLSLGISFTLVTILLLRRLPQSVAVNRISGILAVLFFTGGIFSGGVYYNNFSSGRALRAAMIEAGRNAASLPNINMDSCSLDLMHLGGSIDVNAHLRFTNRSIDLITTYMFSLNPGLEVEKITQAGVDIPFSRHHHVISVTPPAPLEPWAADSLNIYYRGKINNHAMYLDIDESSRRDNFRLALYNIGKQYSFLTEKYVLLTQESMWYPSSVIPYGGLGVDKRDFVEFSLRVTPLNDLLPISQGEMTNDGNAYLFTPGYPLPQISLAIGNYEKRSILADSLEYGIYTLKGHDYFTAYFDELDSLTIANQLVNTRATLDRRMGNLQCHFPRLAIVETPVQFFTYPRLWTTAQENIQPEQIFMPEKGMFIMQADFGFQMRNIGRGMGREGVSTQTPRERQIASLRNFLGGAFQDNSAFLRVIRSAGMARGGQPGGGSQGNTDRMIRSLAIPNITSNYSLFPQYYNFSNSITSTRWPLFNTALEFYLSGTNISRASGFARMFTGLTEEERANRYLMDHSLQDVFRNDTDPDIAGTVLRSKSNYLLAHIFSEVGSAEFREFLDDFLAKNRFKGSYVEEFVYSFGEEFFLDIGGILDSSMKDSGVPAYVVGEARCIEVMEGPRTLYQVTFTVTNVAESDGMISVVFRPQQTMQAARGMMAGRGGMQAGGAGGMMQAMMGGWDMSTERYVRLNGGETKEIGIVLEAPPQSMMINTFISENIPSSIERGFSGIERTGQTSFFEGERLIEESNDHLEWSILVDDTDPGFRTITSTQESPLRRLLGLTDENRDEFTGLTFRNLPRKWSRTVNSAFYGTIYRSATYIRSGNGSNRATWTAEIPERGQYSVQIHMARLADLRIPGARGSQTRMLEDFQYIIHHEDGIDQLNIDMTSGEGWVEIGTYYFREGKAVVELTDKSRGRFVYADAVRWIRRFE